MFGVGKAQAYIKEQLKCKEDKPVFFVFHGGSGSEKVLARSLAC